MKKENLFWVWMLPLTVFSVTLIVLGLNLLLSNKEIAIQYVVSALSFFVSYLILSKFAEFFISKYNTDKIDEPKSQNQYKQEKLQLQSAEIIKVLDDYDGKFRITNRCNDLHYQAILSGCLYFDGLIVYQKRFLNFQKAALVVESGGGNIPEDALEKLMEIHAEQLGDILLKFRDFLKCMDQIKTKNLEKAECKQSD